MKMRKFLFVDWPNHLGVDVHPLPASPRKRNPDAPAVAEIYTGDPDRISVFTLAPDGRRLRHRFFPKTSYVPTLNTHLPTDLEGAVEETARNGDLVED